MNTETVHKLANEHGLVFRGGFLANAEDAVPPQANGDKSKTLLLFGQAGHSLWPVFSDSPEFADKQPDPLDRWSERVGQTIAQSLKGRLLLPFGGPPYYPFVQWASRAEAVQPSKLGMLIHPVHGLWHAYRFAIVLHESISDLPQSQTGDSLCGKCEEKPCLKTCPVDAFNGDRYDVESCVDYLQKHPDSPCHSEGCMARDACPEGEYSHYAVEQKQFHMIQFTQAFYKRLADSENT